MKTLFYSALFIFATSSAAQAQTEQGSLMVGSSLSELEYESSESGHSFVIGVTPTAGLFVADRLALGAQVTLGYQNTKSGPGSYAFKTNVFQYGIAPFARYYVLDAPKHKVFGQASYGIVGYRLENLAYDETSKSHFSSWSVGVGYNYFITPNVALEAQPYYSHRNNRQLVSDRPNTWGLSLGFQIFFPKGSSAAQ